MKALVYKNRTFAFKDMDIPIPAHDEVLIEIINTSLNAGDYRLTQLNTGLPKSGILGNAIAGIVDVVGLDVYGFKCGDHVAVDTSNAGFGGLAEYVLAKASEVVIIPDSVSFIDASACPVASTTALQALTLFKPIKHKDKVLIVGASGGVGTFAVQIAKHLGAQVTAVCSTQNEEMIKRLGADVIINYKSEDLYQVKASYDLILAINGAYPLSLYRRLLKEDGVYVMVGGPIKQFIKNMFLTPLYSLGEKKFKLLNSKSKPEDLKKILQLVSESKIKPIIEKVYPFNEAIDAFKTFEQGHSKGKIIIQIEEDPNT
jgi:NADPH:quinone reductase-like Zn-dependent oxidoreductase